MKTEKLTPVDEGFCNVGGSTVPQRASLKPKPMAAPRGVAATRPDVRHQLYMKAGDDSVATMLKNIGTGFYVTELIGMGVNGVTGDYSRGAAGFWIENGEIAFPVSEMTIAGNLKEMFLQMTRLMICIFAVALMRRPF